MPLQSTSVSCEQTIASRDGACFLCPPEPQAPGAQEQYDRAGALRRQVHIAQCRHKLSEFLKHGWQVLEPTVSLDWAWHIEALCDHIQGMLEDWIEFQKNPDFEQRCRNLAINVPPGSLKSRILSVYAPAWMWLKFPSWRLLALSANPEVADRDADYSKQLIESEWYTGWFQPEWTIRKERDAIRNFQNTAGGLRITRGLNAKVTGLRGDAIFIDDPNDIKEVSDVKLDGVWRNYYAARNRVNDLRCSIRIGIQQRTHEADWTGRVLEGDHSFQHLCIPMERELELKAGELHSLPCVACKVVHTESFLGWADPRTEPDEVLHPERNTPEVLKEEKAAMGAYGTAGQFQQRPSPIGGGMFKIKWWRHYSVLDMTPNGQPDLDACVISVDATFKLEGTSRCCIGCIGGAGPNRFIMDVFVGKVDILGAMREIEAMIERHPYYTKILIEDKEKRVA